MLRRIPNLYVTLLTVMAAILFVVPIDSHAVLSAPDISEIIQPDGTVFKARNKGDEWNNWVETVHGYSVTKGHDGYWYYISGYDGSIPVLSGVEAHKAPPLKVRQHIKPSPDFRRMKTMEEGQDRSLKEAPYGTFSGKILFILAEFNNISGTYSEESFATYIDGDIHDYFSKSSYGKVTLSPANESFGKTDNGVVGWVNLGYDHPNTGGNTGIANKLLSYNAVMAADPYVDFSAYDTNTDGHVDPDELAVVVVVAGYERSYSASYSPSIWGHVWSLYISVDGVTLGGSRGYAQIGEIHRGSDWGAHQATMGIMVHELGHLIFGLPDLYDLDYSSEGIGFFCVMAGGSWGRSYSDTYYGETPVLPSAWVKFNRGWISGTVGPGTISIVAAGSTSATSSNAGHKLSTGLSHEYFLVENRQPFGYDRGLERLLNTGFGGLAIWHIDDNKTSNRYECYPPYSCIFYHYWVALEQADGNWDLEKNNNRGNKTDLWYLGNATTFDAGSTPSSNLYDETASNVSVTDISVSGSTMTFGALSEDLVIQFNSSHSIGSESQASAELELSLSKVSFQDVTVDYVLGGTATGNGIDYTLTAGTVTITTGNTTNTISVPIEDDALDEPDETIILTISNPDNAELGFNAIHTYTIEDDDDQPSVSFTNAPYSHGEIGSRTIIVTLSAESGKEVTVSYTASDGSAIAERDYLAASGTLTWAIGETGAKSFTVTILEDDIDERDETVLLTLSSPGNCTIGGENPTTLTITDDDVTPPDGGSTGGCFIATAAFGTPMKRHVRILREFRDRFLLPNPVGKVLADLYSSSSPPIAEFITKHDTARFMVRWSLLPIVGMSWVALNLGLVSFFVVILLFGTSLVGLAGLRSTYRKT